MTEETAALTSPPPTTRSEGSAPEPESMEPETTQAPAEPQGRKSSPLVVVLLIGLLIAFGAIGWLWQQGRTQNASLRQDLASRLDSSDGIARDARAAARQGQDAVADLQRRLSATEAALAETRGQQSAIEALYQSLARSREDQLLVEVEQAVGLAMQQLQLAGNVEAALAALRAAEARLGKSDAAPLVHLRKALLTDIEMLAGSPRLDVSGTAARIEVLVSAIDRMPLAFMAPPPEMHAAAPDMPASFPDKVKRVFRDLWSELRTLVRVERLDRPDPAFLSPSQEVFLRENLRLRLLSARLSVLAQDDRTYQTDLRLASEWLRMYFDSESEVVRNALEQLAALAKLRLAPDEAPVLQETYKRLRALQDRKPVAVAPTVEAAPAASAAPAVAADDQPARPPAASAPEKASAAPAHAAPSAGPLADPPAAHDAPAHAAPAPAATEAHPAPTHDAPAAAH
ncbi:MAG: uroporphyrinogen-III C-methyltransferase [Rhodocyclaceae bacterium]|nr:uroporphyrinogen-III C-methyltransferase [Rhodocyclaceae bacterium]